MLNKEMPEWALYIPAALVGLICRDWWDMFFVFLGFLIFIPLHFHKWKEVTDTFYEMGKAHQKMIYEKLEDK